LSSEKGVDVLVRAWAHVLVQEGDLRLSILGTGPLQSELKTLCHSLGVAGKVDFMGLMYNVGEFLQEADLFVLPSRTEGLSNALLEAMSYGLPCIATRVGGNEELLESRQEHIRPGAYAIGKGGLLVNSEDAEGLAQAILFLVRNRERRGEIGRRAREYVQENYSIERVADKYLALYQRLLNGRC
jgi:glycosyltransferase involved in cell wall biosynthesis